MAKNGQRTQHNHIWAARAASGQQGAARDKPGAAGAASGQAAASGGSRGADQEQQALIPSHTSVPGPEAEVNEEFVKLESVELEVEVDKENVTVGVFDTESLMSDEILSVESGGSTSRLHGSSEAAA
ncbi:hypothetical protein Acr_03g0010620 [Actinidia rufa]|uniref:Uncharacterized protein n=1 Tax=Actinidia rufa TaxID=165716 RepID=A0A7J0ECT6_9ERIC|nr:hypothetical protein Acr_03g0010620 [Actinidia rufa]